MLGAVKAVLLASAAPAVAGSLYTQRIDATSPRKHLRLSEASGTVAANRGSATGDGTFQNTESITYGLDPLVQNSDGGKSVGLSGATSSTPHVTIEDLVTTATFTLDIAFQADRHKAKHILITQGLSSAVEGAVSLEVEDDGAGGLRLRQWTVIGGSAKIWTTGAGTVPIGSACKISYVQENGFGRRLYVNGVQIGVRTTEASFSAPPTGTWYIGSWPTGSEPVDGCIAEVASWNRALSGAEIGSLAAAQSIIYLGDWSETVTQNESGSIFVSASKTELHPEIGFTTEVVSDGNLVDLTASAGGFDYLTGAASSLPAADSAQVRISKGGLQSRTATISFTVESAPAIALPSAPATNAYWVDPIDGNDGISAAQARSATSSPPATSWRSLAKAIAEWNAGNLGASGSGHVEIILRGGLSYERGNNLTITRDATSGSHLVIKGYRDDIAAGTRGGTGKFTGAKGWFCLRGNIQALETGGWELWSAGRNIYRTTSTFSITGDARAFWLGSTTHNLQLNPARSLDDLNTDNEVGVTTNPIYTAPGLFKHTDNRIYLRMETTQWTRYFDNYFTDSYYPNGTLPTWGTNPSSESMAVFDETSGLTLSGVSWIDLAFFRAQYWLRGLRFLGNTDNCTCDFVHLIASVYCIDGGDAGTLHHIDLTHCDFVQNLPPWIGWTWVKENGHGIQAQLQGRTVNLTATYPHHITIQHCRLIRGFDGGGVDNANPDPAPHDIIFNNNHLLWMRDDSFAFSTSIYDSQFLYNYHELCFAGYGRVGRPSTGSHTNQAPGTVYFGFNILDLRRPLLRGRPASSGTADGEFNLNGTASLAENFGLQWSRMEVSHSIDNDEVSEHKYYHNLIMCGRDESNVGVWGWKDGIQTASVQTERYNNIVVNVENAEYHGRGETRYIEQDYNCYWGDPAGSFSQSKVTVNTAGGSQPVYATWVAFAASGANYNETKHANGDGPGSPSGWEANGIEADPEFVGGTWETIVVGNLATYFPAANGNCGFAVSLAGTGWPGTSSQPGYVGAYAPGDAVTKIGPEQGLWHD